MATVFISHSGLDRAITESVVDRLRGAGVTSLFVDFDARDGIPAGADWEHELYTRVRDADAMIVVVTAAAAESRWCLLEVGLARTFRRRILPLQVDRGARIPFLVDAQVTDYADEEWPTRLREGLEAAGVDVDVTARWDPTRPPYPGLAAFAPEDVGVFFGRVQEVRRLLALLEPVPGTRSGAVVAVIGPSGSGKSSLVKAGLLPRLARDPDRWVVPPIVVPDRDPVGDLASSLEVASRTTNAPRDPAVAGRELRESRERIAGLLDRLAGAAPRRDVLLVVDQAESLFGPQIEVEERRLFLDLLARTRDAFGRVSVVLTVRAEYLSGDPERALLADLCPEASRLMIEPLGHGRLPEVIEGPARRAGVVIDEGLVPRMVGETAGGDALPLLAYTLNALVEDDAFRTNGRRILTWRYDELGGVLAALGTRATEVATRLDEETAATVLPTMLRFVQISEQDEPIARPVDDDALDDPATRTIVDAFVDERLLVRSQDAHRGTTTVRVAHEALLRQWDALRGAIDRAGRGLRLHAELGRLATAWQQNGQDDSYLLGGAQLASVETLLGGRIPRRLDDPADTPEQPIRLDFSARETAFVEASRRHEDRVDARRRLRRVLVAAVAVLVAILAAVGVTQGIAANREAAAAASRSLAAAANDDSATNPGEAAMLAIAAYRESPTAEAEQALFGRYIQNQRVDTVYSGASGNLKQAQVSRDGRVVAALTSNGLLALWTRTPTGRIVQRQGTIDLEAEGLGLSPDGTTVWLKRRTGITRYDVATGNTGIVVPLAPGDVNGSEFAVSADGRTLAAIVGTPQQDALRVWDATTGQVLGELPSAPGLPISSYAFGPGRTIVVDNGIYGITDVSVRRWTAGDPTPPMLLATGVTSTAMTAGSDVVVTCQSPPPSVDFSAPVPPDVLTVRRLVDGSTVRTFPSTVGPCSGVATDARGDRVGALSTSSTSFPAQSDDSASFDLASGRSSTFHSPIHQSDSTTGVGPSVIPGLVSGPDGPQIAVVGPYAVTLLTLPSADREVSDVGWSGLVGDGRTQLAVADGGGSLVLVPTLSPGTAIARAARPAPFWRTGVGDVTVGARGSLVAERVAPDRVAVRRLPDLGTVAEIPTPPVTSTGPAEDDLVAHNLSFDAAGRLVVSVGTDVSVWDPVAARVLDRFDLSATGMTGPSAEVQVRAGRDPSQLTVVSDDRPDVHFVDIGTGREVGRLAAGADVLAAGFDPTGRYVSLLRRAGVIEVWDTRDDSRVLGPLSVRPPGPTVDQKSLAVSFSDSGDLVVGAGSRVRVFALDSPAPIRSLDVGEGQEVNGVSSDGQVITTRPSEGTGLTLSLNPGDWQDELCRVVGDRPFTEAERSGLPAAVPDGPVCPDT